MKVVVVEDEPIAARLVVDLLVRVAPDAVVVAQLASVAALSRWLAAQPPPELILADIELQDGRVFDALAGAERRSPIIFTTAYDHFLLEAFRTQGIAYLMKPLHEAELAAALAKYEDLRRAYAAHNPLAQLAPVASAAPYRRHFTVSVARKIQVVALDRIALIRLGLAGVELVDREGTALSVTGTASLGELEASLPPLQFFRINRTEIVALDAIEHVEPRKDRLGLAIRGVAALVTVSTHRTPAFRRWIGLT